MSKPYEFTEKKVFDRVVHTVAREKIEEDFMDFFQAGIAFARREEISKRHKMMEEMKDNLQQARTFDGTDLLIVDIRDIERILTGRRK